MRVGAVVPVGPGRAQNLWECLTALTTQGLDQIVAVFDGPQAYADWQDYFLRQSFHNDVPPDWVTPVQAHVTDYPHEPGLEQPRNVGASLLRGCDAVWFVDSDVVVEPGAFFSLMRHWQPGRVVAAPYDWLPPDLRGIHPEIMNDPRWAMFQEERWLDIEYASRGELNVGLGCFSGNLLWDLGRFEHLGGFWNELHHGRCEDGELGLRAVAGGVPIALAPTARGYHQWHRVNTDRVFEANARDVPMINDRHPWVEGLGVFVVEEDGKRFDQRCPECGKLVNTGAYWEHRQGHAP